MRYTEYFVYTLISLVTLLSLLLFVPHTLLSSSDDTPLIFYRYLMILAGLLLLLYNIIINFHGIHPSLPFEIKTLCRFLDWLHLLLVIPLAVPFINNIISAAQTASQISVLKCESNELSLVPQNSDIDHQNKNQCQSPTFSKAFVGLLTFLFWSATIICQIFSWYKNDSFYRKILYKYITSAWMSYMSLFVAISFISLYREVDKVQKTFILLQKSRNVAHKNDNSVSTHIPDNDVFPQIHAIQKNEEVIQNLAHHKRKFVKITVFVVMLACFDIYLTLSRAIRQKTTLNTPYNEQPLFETTFNYILAVLSRLLVAIIIYFWLAIDNLYGKKAPIDSIGYLVYAHCCCKCTFCFCCPCLHLLCAENEKHADIDIEMVEIPKIIHFKDSDSKIPAITATSSVDDYANIDNITMFEPNLPEKKINIKIIASSKEDLFETKVIHSPIKHLHAYNNTMTLPTDNNSPVAASHTNVSQMMQMHSDIDGNDEFSALPTYEEKVHGNHGLMGESGQIENNFSQFGSVDNSPHSQIFYPSPNSFPFDSVLIKRAETTDNILSVAMDNSENSAESDDEMIMGIKAIIYSFEILIDADIDMDNIDDVNIGKYETKIKRLTQHLLVMNENIKYVFIVSHKINHENMTDLMQIIHLNDGPNIMGYDHEWIADCKQNIQLILLRLIKKLNIENNELLFVSNQKMVELIEEINVCQSYNVEDVGKNKIQSMDCTLKGKHLMFLESQVLASIS